MSPAPSRGKTVQGPTFDLQLQSYRPHCSSSSLFAGFAAASLSRLSAVSSSHLTFRPSKKIIHIGKFPKNGVREFRWECLESSSLKVSEVEKKKKKMIMKEGRLLLAAAIVPSPGVGPTSPTVNLCISISLQLFFWLCRMCTHSHARTHTHTLKPKKRRGF